MPVPVIAADTSSGSSGLFMWGMMLLLLVAVYFMMIRPQQKRRREQETMQSSVSVGARVLTIGGLYGTVTEISDDSVTLEVAPGVTNRYARGAISRIVASAGDSEEADDGDARDQEPDERDQEPDERDQEADSDPGQKPDEGDRGRAKSN